MSVLLGGAEAHIGSGSRTPAVEECPKGETDLSRPHSSRFVSRLPRSRDERKNTMRATGKDVSASGHGRNRSEDKLQEDEESFIPDMTLDERPASVATAGGEGGAAQKAKFGGKGSEGGEEGRSQGSGGAGGEGSTYGATTEQLVFNTELSPRTAGNSREAVEVDCDLRRQEAGAWEQWLEQKRREEATRRRRQERQRKAQEERVQAERQAVETRRCMEEENRSKWLQRKRREQEEQRRRAEEQAREKERRAKEEAQRQEERMRRHAEAQRRLTMRREEEKKEVAQRRAREEQRAEEELRMRSERSARHVAKWSARTANTPRPVTGSIFNRNPVPSVPKVAVSYCNPEPWQF